MAPLDTELFYDAPETVVAMESFSVNGWLWYYATPTTMYPLAGKTISLWTRQWVDGEPITRKVGDGTTDSFGRVIWSVTLTRGTHELWIRFIGDENYNPCSSPVFTIVSVGQETYITVVDAPPSDSGAGEPFYIAGYFREVDGLALIYKTVELYVDGAKIKSERTGCSIIPTVPEYDPGRWRFAVPTPQTLGTHTVEVRFPGDDIHEPSSSGVMEFNAVESLVVPTIENVYVPTTVAPWEYWLGYFHLCNRGTGAGYVRAVLQGDIDGATPNILLNPGACQTIAIGGTGPASFTIRAGV